MIIAAAFGRKFTRLVTGEPVIRRKLTLIVGGDLGVKSSRYDRYTRVFNKKRRLAFRARQSIRNFS